MNKLSAANILCQRGDDVRGVILGATNLDSVCRADTGSVGNFWTTCLPQRDARLRAGLLAIYPIANPKSQIDLGFQLYLCLTIRGKYSGVTLNVACAERGSVGLTPSST